MSRAAVKKALPRPAFAPGARIEVRGEEWIVRGAENSASGGVAVRCSGLSELVRNKDAIFLSALDDIVELKPEETALVQDASPHYRKSRLYIESLLRQTPPTDDRIYVGHEGAMNAADYQLVPTAQALAQPRPRILIADGVGLGKTIEVGILLSELIRRGRGRRILVVALKSILSQFQKELWSRFTIPLVRLDSVGIQRVQAKIPSNMNPFFYFDRVIISIDTLKKDEKYRRFLKDCRWDAIVIDECQHVAERARLGSSQLSQRAKVAKLLAGTCDALVLTSATPHDGRPESFASLMNLLEPTSIANPTNYGKDEIDGLFVRRFKKDIVHEVRGSFQDRKIHADHIDASAAENHVFELLAQSTFKTIAPKRRADASEHAGAGVLLQTLLLKAFLSSPAALECTTGESLKSARLGEDRLADAKVQHDRTTLLKLQTAASEVSLKHNTKLKRLVALLREHGIGDRGRDERVVVFSERIQTLTFLQEQLRKTFEMDEDQVAVFHGTLDDQKQLALVEDFQTKEGKVRILLASDAASEGINLHFFCHRLVHYDIPWSLITLEQRNGRIDRYGQTQVPEIHYLLSVPENATLRGDLRVLDRLIEKEENAQRNIGDAASLMGLYDPAAEEERVAEGIGAHEAPEDILPEADEDDFLSELMGDAPKQQGLFTTRPVAALESLFANDFEYTREGFAELADDETTKLDPPEWHEHLQGMTLQAPDDLKQRYAYMPPELHRASDWEFKLTADRDRVQQALEASRKSSASWPEWELLWSQHPILQWLNDRVVASFRRHEAPIVRVPAGLAAGESGFLVQGVLSNQRSQPMVVEWFAVVRTSGKPRIVSFAELVRGGAFAPSIPNAGSAIKTDLSDWRTEAVAAARAHLSTLRSTRGDRMRKDLKDQQRKMNEWKRKTLERLDEQEQRWKSATGKLRADQARRLEAERAEVEDRVEQRSRWIQEGLATSEQAYVRIAAALVGPTAGKKGRG